MGAGRGEARTAEVAGTAITRGEPVS